MEPYRIAGLVAAYAENDYLALNYDVPFYGHAIPLNDGLTRYLVRFDTQTHTVRRERPVQSMALLIDVAQDKTITVQAVREATQEPVGRPERFTDLIDCDFTMGPACATVGDVVRNQYRLLTGVLDHAV